MIKALFPSQVVTVTATPAMWDGKLYPEEAAFIQKAVIKRRREFTAGRLCAKAALKALGITGFPVLSGDEREPLWPSGITGSISHCDDYCGVALARQSTLTSIGLDIETIAPLDDDLEAMICTPQEITRANQSPPPSGCNWQKFIFSAKESVYKSLFPVTRAYLDFHDLEIVFDIDKMQFSATLLTQLPTEYNMPDTLTGHFRYNESHIFTGIALSK